jgi:hypothetical protein
MGDGPVAAKTRVLEPDHYANGFAADSPLALGVMFLLCAIAYGIFSVLQITSTEQTILELLSVSVTLQPGLTQNQFHQFMSGSMDRYAIIADAIGWAVQVALTTIAFSPNSGLQSLHRRFGEVSPSITRSVSSFAKWRSFLYVVLVGGDIVTDFYYVVQGRNLIPSWNGALPDISSSAFGVVLVGLVYPAAVCFVTIFVGKYMFVYLGKLVSKFFPDNPVV